MTEAQIIDILESYSTTLIDGGRAVKENEYFLVAQSILSQETEPVEDSKQLFEEFRILYRSAAGKSGRVRGLDTEYKEFKKKHKDYQKVAPLLKEALQKQINHRKVMENKGEFVPFFKNLSTWLNQRDWEYWIEMNVETAKKMSF